MSVGLEQKLNWRIRKDRNSPILAPEYSPLSQSSQQVDKFIFPFGKWMEVKIIICLYLVGHWSAEGRGRLGKPWACLYMYPLPLGLTSHL